MKKKKQKNKPKSKAFLKILWIVFLGGIFSVFLLFFLIAKGIIGYMPPIEDLENPIDKYASQVYSADGELLGTYSRARENRIYSSYDDLSTYLVQALVATEDIRFYSHSGIDAQAVARAVIKTGIMQQKSGGGGSTISQQLAKLLFSPKAGDVKERVLQKPIEWVIAANLERYYTKEDIINLYLNKFDFLNNAVGIHSATQVYFNKTPKELNVQEAATLIGMCQNPALYNPVRRLDATRGRRNVVLDQMYKAEFIKTKNELDSLKQLPLVLDYKRVDHKDGLAPYFREYLRMTMTAKKPVKPAYNAAQWLKDQYQNDSLQWDSNPLYGWCRKNQKPDGSYYDLYTDGLRIYATIDSRMQKYAEEAVEQHVAETLQPLFDKEKHGRSYAPFSSTVAKDVESLLTTAMKRTDRYKYLKNEKKMNDQQIYQDFQKPVEMKVFSWKGEVDTIMSPWDSIRYHKSFLRSGFMAMNPNGQVKAYVGGINFKFFQYDMINMGRRQIGSTAKPFLYTLAMQDGMTPCNTMIHGPQTLYDEIGRPHTARNGNTSRIGEPVSIKWGLQNSDNWVTMYLMKQTTPYNLARMMHSFGITGKIDPVISLGLGVCDVSVGEMVGSYTAFVNKGIRTVPLYVTRIEDQHGNIISTFTPEMIEVFDETTYVKMLDMLRAVIDAGTGNRVRRNFKIDPKLQMGGKTGTTQSNSDGWFMGFSPELVAGCWVGGEDRSIHFDRTAQGQGASMALPIFGKFMEKVYADPSLGYNPEKKFEEIKGNPDPCARESSGSVDYDFDYDPVPVGIDDMFN